MNERVKISFQLTDAEAGPYPVGMESLWCHVEGDEYRIKNIPMFLHSVAYDDLVKITEVSENEYRVCEMSQKSGNSTVLIQTNTESEPIINELKKMGCSIEGGAFEELFSINIPKEVCWEPIGRFLDCLDEEDEIVMKFSSFNHDDY